MKGNCFLIGLDGATFHILDPLMDAGVMPFLKRFADDGVRANLISVVPPITPPAWTSMVTGRSPGFHGVFDFFHREKGSHHIRFTSSGDVHCETVWAIASRNGARVTTLNFPLMMPPPEINGNVVSGGWLTCRQLRLGCHPEGLYDRIKTIPCFSARELVMDMAHEGKALDGCSNEEYEEWIQFHIRREKHWAGILDFLVREDPCDLTAILFDGTDKIQHLCWRFISPDFGGGCASGWELNIRSLCLEYYATLDRLIAGIVERAGADATVILASDHGFGAQTEILFINGWLQQNGYLQWADNDALKRDHADGLGMGELGKHSYLIDWDKTLAYASTPSSNGIHIVVEGEGYGKGIPRSGYERFRNELASGLLDLRSPGNREPVVAKVWTREECFSGPYMDRAPDLTLGLRDGGLVSILSSDVAVKEKKWPSGTHRMEGILMARGPGIRRGERLDQVSILDVFPTMLYCLGLPIPEEAEGRVPLKLFEEARLRNNPVLITGHSGAGAPGREERADQPVYDAEDEAKIAERLRALGYIE